jgi:hypothetical protein
MPEVNCQKCGQGFQTNAEVNGVGPVCPRCAAGIPPSPELTREFLAWVREQINEEEVLAALDEVRAGGGKELKEFIHELEQVVGDQ